MGLFHHINVDLESRCVDFLGAGVNFCVYCELLFAHTTPDIAKEFYLRWMLALPVSESCTKCVGLFDRSRFR